MKVRSGFVSNSSSSSFVLLGSNIKDDVITQEMKMNILDKNNIDYNPKDKYSINDAWYENVVYGGALGLSNPTETDAWGDILAEGDDCDMIEDGEYSFDALIERANEIKQKIKDTFDLDVEIKIITGTYSC